MILLAFITFNEHLAVVYPSGKANTESSGNSVIDERSLMNIHIGHRILHPPFAYPCKGPVPDPICKDIKDIKPIGIQPA